jgi:hypothetical protein
MMDHQDAEQQLIRLELDRRTREWNRKLADMRAELDRKDEQIQQEQRSAEMMGYIARRRVEERDEIAPELMSFITGSTIEEVEQAITRAKAKTASILEGVRQAQALRGPAGVPTPQAQQQPQQPTLEQLRAVEVGSPEHLVLRRQFGMDKRRGQGIFG